MAAYDAFISYSHAKDKPIAAALQSVVQRLGKPWYRRRALRVFRDDTSLSATPELWPSIEQALDRARRMAADGADIVDIAQVFQRSGTLQVSFKDKNITTAAQFRGKKIGNWGFGNEYEIFAALSKAGLDPAKDRMIESPDTHVRNTAIRPMGLPDHLPPDRAHLATSSSIV